MYPVYIQYYLTGILVALVLLKSFLFIGSTSKHNLLSWFFFNTNAMYNSRNTRSRKMKVVQNRLTLIILIVAAADAVSMLMFH